MGQYIVRRVLQALLTIVLVMVALFLLTQVIGDPVGLMLLEGTATPGQAEELRHQLGLDQPVLTQLQQFFGKMLVGDFGESWIERRPVIDILSEKLLNTLRLVVLGTSLGIIPAMAIGLYISLKPGSPLDYVMRMLAFAGHSAPGFWLALMIILLFAVVLGLFPAGGKAGWESYVLPSFVIAIRLMSALVRLTRSSALEILGTDYIKLVKLKGLPTWLTLFKHVLRNVATIVVTFLGMTFATLVTQSIVVETIFFWPGFGRALLTAIYERDFPVLRAGLFVGVLIFIFIQLGVDILYAYINPEIRVMRKAGISR